MPAINYWQTLTIIFCLASVYNKPGPRPRLVRLLPSATLLHDAEAFSFTVQKRYSSLQVATSPSFSPQPRQAQLPSPTPSLVLSPVLLSPMDLFKHHRCPSNRYAEPRLVVSTSSCRCSSRWSQYGITHNSECTLEPKCTIILQILKGSGVAWSSNWFQVGFQGTTLRFKSYRCLRILCAFRSGHIVGVEKCKIL